MLRQQHRSCHLREAIRIRQADPHRTGDASPEISPYPAIGRDRSGAGLRLSF